MRSSVHGFGLARQYPTTIERRPSGRGVCAGIAQAIGLDPILVRLAVLVLTFSGPGAPAYAIAWLVMPEVPRSDIDGADGQSPIEMRRGVGLVMIVLGAVLGLRELGLTPPDAIVWPILLVGIGVGIVLWQVQPSLEFSRWAAARIAAGIIVVGSGLAAFVAGNISSARCATACSA